MGTTSEKLTYLNTTKTLIKEELNLGGANITNEPFRAYKDKLEGIYKDFLANGTDTLWNNWLPKVTGSGETITLNNTIEAKMDFVYKGNTYQYSTTGKNLLRYDAGTYTSGNITNATYGNIAVLDINNSISLVEGETYYISADIKLNSGTCQILNTLRVLNSNGGRTENNTATIQQPTISNNYQRYIFSFVAKENVNGTKFYAQGYNMSNASFTITNIMLSTTNANYEPYTGGIASPNPDYPQDIQVVSGDNEVVVCGKNLFNLTNQTTTINGVAISVKGSEITLNGTCNGWGTFNQNLSIKLNSNESYYLSVKNFTNNAPVNFTTPEGILYNNVGLINNKSKITRFQIQIIQGKTYNNLTYKIQLEKSSTATTYEEYKGQTYPISLGNIELCKIGTYQDKIVKSTGKNITNYSNWEQGNFYVEGTGINDNVESANVIRMNDFVDVEPNTTYTLSCNQILGQFGYIYKDTSNDMTGSFQIVGEKYYTFTTPSNCKQVRLRIGNSSYPKTYGNNYEIQLEKGNQATPYEPYGTGWYLNKQIGKVVLNGSETSWQENGATKGLFQVTKSNTISSLNKVLVKSTHFRAVTGQYLSDNASTEDLITSNFTSNRLMFIYKQYANNLTDFKTWLSTHNTTVYYVLATPTTTEITDTTLISQLEAIKKSYNTQTNISQTNADKPFILDVVALGELT